MAAMTALRHAARWAWPTGPRPTRTCLRDALAGLALRLGIYGSLGLATWAHWWHAVRP